ncbi:MAG: hypothetical protein M1828_007339 [Chrysothrix sp. TS-e1954]|nr:MAG: hypothetical protein M1828_007339 [Chrysothrix sp. TS-e1954]
MQFVASLVVALASLAAAAVVPTLTMTNGTTNGTATLDPRDPKKPLQTWPDGMPMITRGHTCYDEFNLSFIANTPWGTRFYSHTSFYGECWELPQKLDLHMVNFIPNDCVDQIELWPFKGCKYPESYAGFDNHVQFKKGQVLVDYSHANKKERISKIKAILVKNKDWAKWRQNENDPFMKPEDTKW